MVAPFRRLGKDAGALIKGEQGPSIVAHHIRQWNMSRGGQKIGHENNCLTFVGEDGTHLCVGMAVNDKDIEAQWCAYSVLAFWGVYKF